MNQDIKDIAIVKASALVGYCQSGKDIQFASTESMEAWFRRLMHYVEATAHALDAAYIINEPTHSIGIAPPVIDEGFLPKRKPQDKP